MIKAFNVFAYILTEFKMYCVLKQKLKKVEYYTRVYCQVDK